LAREVDVAITYGHALQRPGVEVIALGKERIAPLCSPALRDAKRPWKDLLGELTLIDSQLSQVTWRDWFALNDLAMTPRPRQSFDRAALAISAAVDGMGVTLESTRLAERELARGDLIEVGATVFKHLDREMHFFSQRSNEKQLGKIQCFRDWLLAQLKLSSSASETSSSGGARRSPSPRAASRSPSHTAANSEHSRTRPFRA
jgi:DNA-binding transcriptional LysR family regulator